MKFTPEEKAILMRGGAVDMAGKRWMMCQQCRQAIRVNKCFFGSLHICELTEEEEEEV